MFPIQTFGTSAMYLSAVLWATMQTKAWRHARDKGRQKSILSSIRNNKCEIEFSFGMDILPATKAFVTFNINK